MTSADLGERLYGIEKYTPGDPSTKDLHLAASSGTTTGVPSLHVVQRRNLEKDIIYDEWFTTLRSTVRLTRNQHMSLQSIGRALMSGVSNRIMILDEYDMKPERLAHIMSEYQPETLNGPPSRILLWAKNLIEGGAKDVLQHITKLFIFSELMTPFLNAHIKETLPNAAIKHGYSISGVSPGTIGCPHAQYGEYHHILLGGDSVPKFQIAEPDQDGLGEIVISTRTLTNFRTGDLGKIETAPCPCGYSPILFLYGRKDFDRVSILGTQFIKSEVERVLTQFTDQIIDYQLRVGEIIRDEKVIGVAQFVFIPSEDNIVSNPEIIEHIQTRLFVTKTRTLGEVVDTHIFMPLMVSRVSMIPQGKKQVRLRRLTPTELTELSQSK